MKQFVLMCSESVKELKKTQNMVLCALIAAIAVILSYTTTIEIGPYIKLGLSQIPNQVVSYLFGPIVG
ncbi:ECF transporter S component, partial [Lachnotalea glycerini]